MVHGCTHHHSTTDQLASSFRDQAATIYGSTVAPGARVELPYFNGAKVSFQRTIVFYYDGGGRNEHNTAAVEL